MPAPHPLAVRIHDRVLQLVGTCMLKVELAETLGQLGRHEDVPAALSELRAALDETVMELRSIMADLKNQAAEPMPVGPPLGAPTGAARGERP